MAKKVAKKEPKKQEKQLIKPRKPRVSIAQAAAKAAQVDESFEVDEAQLEFDSPEERDLTFATFSDEGLSIDDIDSKDVFLDSLKWGRQHNKGIKFRIYKDSQWLTVKDSTYTWEKLQKEFGGGYFKVVGVDSDNVIRGSQSMTMAEPPGWNQNQPQQQQQQPLRSEQPSAIELMEQARIERREAELSAGKSESSMATVISTMMTSMMTMQQQSSQQFQMLMMESQKQQQAATERAQATQMELLKMMMMQKPEKSNDGFTSMSVMKLVSDAARDAKADTEKMFKMIEERSEKLAEEKAELLSAADKDEPEDSLSKTALKAFMPVLSQIMASSPAGGGGTTAPQLEAPYRAGVPDARLGGLTPEQYQGQQIAKQNELAEKRRQQEVQQRVLKTRAGVPQTIVGTVDTKTPVQGETADLKGPENKEGVKVVQNNGRTNDGAGVAAPVKAGNLKTGAAALDVDFKQQIFGLVAMDIGEAMIGERPAGKTAEFCLKKLEKAGFARQTVKDSIKEQDIFNFARANNVPAIADDWLKEFSDAIQTSKAASSTARAEARQSSPSI